MVDIDETISDNEMDPARFDYVYKIVVIGSSGVGKTSFLRRYFDKKFEGVVNATVGVDFRHRNFKRLVSSSGISTPSYEHLCVIKRFIITHFMMGFKGLDAMVIRSCFTPMVPFSLPIHNNYFVTHIADAIKEFCGKSIMCTLDKNNNG